MKFRKIFLFPISFPALSKTSIRNPHALSKSRLKKYHTPSSKLTKKSEKTSKSGRIMTKSGEKYIFPPICTVPTWGKKYHFGRGKGGI